MRPADWLEIVKYFSLVTWLGLTMVVSVYIGWRLGALLQSVIGGFTWVAAGLLLGVAGGVVAVYSTLKKIVPWE